MSRHLIKEDLWTANEHMKGAHLAGGTGEMIKPDTHTQKTPVPIHYSDYTVTIINKKDDNTKCWQEFWATGTFIHCL